MSCTTQAFSISLAILRLIKAKNTTTRVFKKEPLIFEVEVASSEAKSVARFLLSVGCVCVTTHAVAIPIFSRIFLFTGLNSFLAANVVGQIGQIMSL